MKYSYSDNEETFHGQRDSIEAAIAEALDEFPDAETIYVGEVTQKTIGGFLHSGHIESLLESLSETAYDECGEAAEDWLTGPHCCSRDIKKETREQYEDRVKAWRKRKADWLEPLLTGVQAVLESWAPEHDEQPHFWHVGKVKSFSREEAEALLEPGH